MAERLIEEYRQDIQEVLLKPASGGIFEVSVDGKLLFSKKELKRHAEPNEVETLVREFHSA